MLAIHLRSERDRASFARYESNQNTEPSESGEAKPALRICPHPGCSTLVPKGRCALHKRKTEEEHDALRGTATQRGYDARWRVARAAFLRLHPLCECEDCRAGALTARPATVVDHKIDHKGNMALFWDESNWQAMSKSCHDRKTRRTNPRVNAEQRA